MFVPVLMSFLLVGCDTVTLFRSFGSLSERLEPASRGEGISKAALYDPAAQGPHRLYAISRYGSAHEWNDTLPSEWISDSVKETEFLVVVSPEREVNIDDTIYYSAAVELGIAELFINIFEVEVFEARTGSLLWEGQVLSDNSAVESWLQCKVMPDECETRVLEGHYDEVWDVAFSPDGEILASGSDDSTVRLWRSSDGAFLRELKGHTDLVYSVIFSPDSEMLASSSYDETVRLWQVSDGTLLHTLEGHEREVRSVAFSPDGNILASASNDGAVRMWIVSNGTLLRTLDAPSARSVAFSPDGSILAAGTGDENVYLWNVDYGSLLRSWNTNALVDCVAFSPDGQVLATGGGRQSVNLWQVSDGELLKEINLDMDSIEGEFAQDLSFSPDGEILAVGLGGSVSTIRLFGLPAGYLLDILEGHNDEVLGVSFSPDGFLLASGSYDRTVRLWQIDKP